MYKLTFITTAEVVIHPRQREQQRCVYPAAKAKIDQENNRQAEQKETSCAQRGHSTRGQRTVRLINTVLFHGLGHSLVRQVEHQQIAPVKQHDQRYPGKHLERPVRVVQQERPGQSAKDSEGAVRTNKGDEIAFREEPQVPESARDDARNGSCLLSIETFCEKARGLGARQLNTYILVSELVRLSSPTSTFNPFMFYAAEACMAECRLPEKYCRRRRRRLHNDIQLPKSFSPPLSFVCLSFFTFFC